jgi:hypothetical protein
MRAGGGKHDAARAHQAGQQQKDRRGQESMSFAAPSGTTRRSILERVLLDWNRVFRRHCRA